MSVTLVQSNPAFTTVSVSSQFVSFTSPVTSGNFICVAITSLSTFFTSSLSITDSFSNTYTQDANVNTVYSGSDQVVVAVFSAVTNSSGSLTLTIHTGTLAKISVALYEFNVTGGALAFDVKNNNTGGSSNPSTGTVSVVGPDLVVAAFDVNTSGLTYTAGSGYTIGPTVNNAGAEGFVTQYNLALSGSSNPDCTLSSSASWTGLVVAYGIVTPTIVYDSDASFATDQQTVLNFFVFAESSLSLDSFLRSVLLYSTDKAFADQSNEVLTALILKVSYDSGIGLESQELHNVVQNYDADSAFGDESQFYIGQFFFGIEDTPLGDESDLPQKLSSDFSTALDRQVFSSSIFYSTDQAVSLETQLKITTGGSSGTVFDINPTVGVEAWLRIVSPADIATGRENQFISSSIFNTGVVDAASSMGQETQLPIRFSYDFSSSQDTQSIGSFGFISTDSAIALDTQLYSHIIISTDFARELEAYIVFTSLVSASTGIVDSATGKETQLPIRLDSDSITGSEYQSRSIFGNASSAVTDNGIGNESVLRIFFSIDSPVARDAQIVLSSFVSTTSGTTDSALGMETQLRINTDSDSPIAINENFRIFFDTNPAFEIDTQVLFNFSISSSTGITDSAIGNETQLRIMFDGDPGFSFDTNNASAATVIIPPASTTSITDVLNGIFIYLSSTGVVGPNNIDFVIDPDSTILYPTSPGPILLIQPLSLTDAGDTIGGGRYSKTWNWDITIHVIVDNILDQAFRDMTISESASFQNGPFQLAYTVQTLMEQSYLLNALYQPVTIEFPYFLSTDMIRRYKGANNYAGIPIRFSVVFRDNLPSLNIP